MAGTKNTINSNIPLALGANPQGEYTPKELADMEDHFSSTQMLSQIISDAVSTRVLFLVGATAGMFIQVGSNGTAALGIPASTGGRAMGFLKADVSPGEYGIIWGSGINSNLAGLIPGRMYTTSAPGGVTLHTAGAGEFYIGFAITTTAMVVQNMAFG